MEGPQVITNDFELVVNIPINADAEDAAAEQDYIAIDGTDKAEDVIAVLGNEGASADLWHRVALLYYRKGDIKSFLQIADEGYTQKNPVHNPDNRTTSVVPILLSISGYYYNVACLSEGDPTRAEEAMNKSINCYNKITALGVKGYEAEYYMGRAYMYLLKKELVDAEKHFTFILSDLDSNYVPAIIGRGLIAFSKMEYKTALMFFRRALVLDPYGFVNVRVGIGHCFWKLGQHEKAQIAFERAVELYPNDHNALSALAICYLRKMKKESIIVGIKLMERSHSICKTHPATLLFLADHYYYKKDYDKALNLALDVCRNTEVDGIRKRSAYLAARCYQAKEDFKYAMHYYYEAVSEPVTIEGFNLPYFGLAQCYLHYNDFGNSVEILKKILNQEPNNYLAKKMMGSIGCNSDDPGQRLQALQSLKTVLDRTPEDPWTRLSLATALECVDDNKAKEHYLQALEQLKSKNLEMSPEIYSNLGCIYFRLEDYGKAMENFELALEVAESESCDEEVDERPWTTLKFNKARTKEALHDYSVAETIYKDILKEHPSYISCFIRLAIMYRDMNNLHEADVYFKEALQCSLEQPDVWAYMGNLHLAQGETGPAEKKFMRIVKMSKSLYRDPYSMIALANIETSRILDFFFEPQSTTADVFENSVPKAMKRTVDFFKTVLDHDPSNMWAANGMGCILAAKGLFTDAREVFSQVRECNTRFKDVWMNIAHTYMEQELYFNAIQMYERCAKKFSQSTDYKVLQFIAKAHYLNKSYQEAKIALLKCRRVAPYDPLILFALAKTLRKIGWLPFQSQSAGITDSQQVNEGLDQIKLAKQFFEAISNKLSNPSTLITAAAMEAQHCDDLIRQTPHMISRIEAEFQREQSIKNRRVMEIKAFKDKQRREQVLIQERKQISQEHAIIHREAIQQKVKKVRESLELEASVKLKKRVKKALKEKLVDTSFIDDSGENPQLPSPTGAGDDGIMIPLIKKPKKSVSKKKNLDPDYSTKKKFNLDDSQSPPVQPSRKRKRLQKKVKFPPMKRKVRSIKISDDEDEEDDGTHPPLSLSPPLVTLEDIQENDSGGMAEDAEEKPLAKLRPISRAYSPDITSFTGNYQRFSAEKKDGEEMASQTGSERNEDDNMLYLDIFSKNANENGNDEGEGEVEGIYDDLPPPLLTRIDEEVGDECEYESGSDDLPPPVLHTFHSDNED